ncbi:selenide, water dikinase [Franzmannia pantelleriensis]|uniref:Selenide, water dikinase n=1 Tax=Franzmannia pantelleriensis TaxID=48727 RepID=A0A1G9IIL5_9GAMM|nr:FAD-dependent oxidoreductase [Halomonas pantelleriensis]SDL24962.1 selenide, water dikinase [Halomonas pantelleriensis]
MARELLLVGGGHSHVEVLRRFALAPEPDVRLTLISRDRFTPYSGMLPGYLAGHYAFDDVHIDLVPLAEAAGARFLRDSVDGLDLAAQRVIPHDHSPLTYDRLSLNIGASPQLTSVPGAAEHATPLKPIDGLNARWLALLERLQQRPVRKTIMMVGGGAGGVEVLLAMQQRLQHLCRERGVPDGLLRFCLVTRGPRPLATHNARVQRHFSRLLTRRGVALHSDAEVVSVDADQLHTADGRTLAYNELLWATQAGAAAWLADTGLALDGAGFIRVDDHLASISHPHVFAAGDIASMVNYRREKAGVHAVRQGPALADNLRASLHDRPLARYRPQRRHLALISTGDRYAVASRGPWSWSGDWVWRWKDRIDRRFMARYRPPLTAP